MVTPQYRVIRDGRRLAAQCSPDSAHLNSPHSSWRTGRGSCLTFRYQTPTSELTSKMAPVSTEAHNLKSCHNNRQVTPQDHSNSAVTSRCQERSPPLRHPATRPVSLPGLIVTGERHTEHHRAVSYLGISPLPTRVFPTCHYCQYPE